MNYFFYLLQHEKSSTPFTTSPFGENIAFFTDSQYRHFFAGATCIDQTGIISGSGGVSMAGTLNPFGLFPDISILGQGALINSNEPNYGHGGGVGALPQQGYVDLSY